MRVTEENLHEVKVSLPEDQAQMLHPGCETWPVFPFKGTAGHITVWPQSERAAVCWGDGSFWGKWKGEDRVIELDEPVGERQVVVDESGSLWIALSGQDFLDRMIERYIRSWDVDGLRRVADGADPLSLQLRAGCSVLPIYKGQEMAQRLFEVMADPEGPLARLKPIVN